MRISIAHITFLLFIMIGCNSENKKEIMESPLLIVSNNYNDYALFIQNNPNTVHFKEAISSYLNLADSLGYIGVCDRINLKIHPLLNDSVWIAGYIYPLDSVRQVCYDYLTFSKRWKNYTALQEEIIIPNSDKVKYFSSGGFDITVFGNNFSFEQIQNTAIEVTKGINDYKKYFSLIWFNKKISEIDKKQKNTIDSIIGLRLNFFHFSEEEQQSMFFLKFKQSSD